MTTHRAAALLTVAAVAWSGASAVAQQQFDSEHGPIRVVEVAGGLEHPWGLAFLPDGRMLVTERPGRLRIVGADGRLSPPIEGVPDVYASGQGGLLDVALDPDFERNRLVYLSYADGGMLGASTAVSRGRLEGNRLRDVQRIFKQQPQVRGGRHWGSRLVFAPDGRLFVTTGDRGQPDRAQELNGHIGKLIRIERDGRVPSDNPFVGRAGVRPEIWSYGHRNIQGAALHPETGALWLNEHGARGGDEVNLPEAGLNYGWPVIAYGVDYSGAKIGEGTHKEGMEQPLFYWDPSIAPSGMAFYEGDKFPEWRGNALIGALAYRLVARLELDGTRVVHEERLLEGMNERIRDVRVGPDGYVWLLTDEPDGRLLRLERAEG
ncbi:MAG: PQQ-dependent sugar dehydrogenase [Alphaproteobacteria bacterium]